MSTISDLQRRFPDIDYVAGENFYWCPGTHEVVYDQSRHDDAATWSLLHETGHALLGHNSYLADFELLKIEIAAWQKARELADEMGITINEDHIQDCLDTYRDWLHKRSVCPSCNTQGLQQNNFKEYRCFNCHSTWKVSPSRFCRAYRTKTKTKLPIFANLSN